MGKKTDDSRVQEALNRLKAAKQVVYDSETSGLSWQRNHIVGHVLTFGPSPDASYYLPVRHAGGGNIGDHKGPKAADGWDGKLHKIEPELLKYLDRPDLKITGHHLSFDIKFLKRSFSSFQFRSQYFDTMINAPLLDEWVGKYSLEACAQRAKVQAKKSDEIVDHICRQFPEAGKDRRGAMGYYWRLAGNDPIAVSYAEGDGTTTYQLELAQMKEIEAQELSLVHGVESRLIKVLARMTTTGIKIDEERLDWLEQKLKDDLEKLMNGFPSGFNTRSSTDVRAWMEKHGHTDWPMTQPTLRFPDGQPSFTETWLENHPAGKAVIDVRKLTQLRDSFVIPLKTTHMYKGRVHTQFHQLRNDEFGTITGRLCLAAGTKVTVPGGYKNIEDIQPGDWVYSFNNNLNLTLKRVKWAGKTGKKPLFRVHWKGTGNTSVGFLDATGSHLIRLLDGSYRAVSELTGGRLVRVRNAKRPNYGKLTHNYGERVLSLSRRTKQVIGGPRNYLYPTGCRKDPLKEARFVYEQVHGQSPQHVHHKNGNSIDDRPDNLEGLTPKEHAQEHANQMTNSQKRRMAAPLHRPEVMRKSLKASHDAMTAKADARTTREQVKQALANTGSMVKAAATLGFKDYTTFKLRVDRYDLVKPNPRLSAKNIGIKTARRIRQMKGSHVEVAAKFGLDASTVSRIRSDKIWREDAVNHNHQITYIEQLPGKHDTYDIEVEETHNFIANELCVHNSSSDPNLQAVHKRNEKLGRLYRSVFVPDEGKIWFTRDYSQIEPRLLAEYSRCKALVDGYSADPPIDAHRAAAIAMTRNWDELTEAEQKDRRETGKRVNQTLITGGGTGVLTTKYKIPPNEARTIFSDYFRAMPEIKVLQKRSAYTMRTRGYVMSLLKRRARLFNRDKDYVALNRLLQCGNADILKIKLVEMDDYLETVGRPVDLLLNCHDAFDSQAPEEARPHLVQMNKIALDFGPDAVIKLKIPMQIDSGEGKNWAEATYPNMKLETKE